MVKAPQTSTVSPANANSVGTVAHSESRVKRKLLCERSFWQSFWREFCWQVRRLSWSASFSSQFSTQKWRKNSHLWNLPCSNLLSQPRGSVTFFLPSLLRVMIFTLCEAVVDFTFLTAVQKSNPIKFYIQQIVTVPAPEDWANGRGQRDANKQASRWIIQRWCQQHAHHSRRRHCRPPQPWHAIGTQEEEV